MKHSDIIKKMSLEQKANIVSGYDYWHLEEIPEYVKQLGHQLIGVSAS